MKLILEENDLYLGLHLENDNTGSIIKSQALKEGFRKQNKRHITILYGSKQKLIVDILNKSSVEKRESIKKEIKDIFESLKWEYTPTEIYKIQKEGYFDDPSIVEKRKSYINMINMPDMEVFYHKLNSLLKSNLPTQVPHITLFTKGERKNPKWYGIPIPSIKEFNSLSPKKIT